MQRFVLTLIASLTLVLTIGFGVSAATNGQGLGALGRGNPHPILTPAGRSNTNSATKNGATGKGAKSLTATPFEFDPGHTGIVAGDWVKHLGLPQDNDKNRFGLLLSKNGPTTTNASAGVVIHGAKGLHLKELGFDVRNGGHCGAGAPRFNVVTSDGAIHFYGCVYGTHTAETPAPGWQRVRFDTSVDYPGAPHIDANLTVDSLTVVFDEGTDLAAPDNAGMVVLDNLDINGVLIGGPGEA